MVRFTLRRKIGFGHRSLKEDVNDETHPVSKPSSPDLSSSDGSGSSEVDATNITNKHSSASTRNEDLISIMSLGVEHRHRTPPTKVHVPYHTQHVSSPQQQLLQQHHQYGSSSSLLHPECSNSSTFSQSPIRLCLEDSGVRSSTTTGKEPVWKRRLRHNSTPKRASSAPKTTTAVTPTPLTPASCTPPKVPTRLPAGNLPASTAIATTPTIARDNNNISSGSSTPHASRPEIYTHTRAATPAEILALKQQQQKEQLKQLQLQVMQRKQEQMLQQLAAHQRATATAIAKGALEATSAKPDLLTRRLNAVVSPKCVSFDEVSLSQKVPKNKNNNTTEAHNHNKNHHHHNHHLGQGHQYLRPTRNSNNGNIATDTGRGRYSPEEQQLAGINRINSSFSDVFKDTRGGAADGFSLDTPTIYTDTSFTYTDDDTTISSYPRSRASSGRRRQRRRRNGGGGGGRTPRSGATSAASSLGKVEEDEESMSMVGADGYVCPVALDTAGLFDDINVVATFISQQSPAACSMIFNNATAGDEVDDDATGRTTSCESTKAESRNTTRTNNNNNNDICGTV